MPGKTVDYSLPSECPFGLSEYKTSLGVFITNVHYTADPVKRNPDWKANIKKGFPNRDWLREFELDWTVNAGQAVAAEFKRDRHVTTTVLQAQPNAIVTVGWDFGWAPAAVFGQQNAGQGQILRALHPTNESLLQFGATVLVNMFTRPQLQQMFPFERCQAMRPPMTFATLFPDKMFEGVVSLSEQAGEILPFEHVGDPAGRNRNAASGENDFSYLKRVFGIVVTPMTNNRPMRLNALDTAFMEGAEALPGQPLVVVSAGSQCDFLVEGLAGAYAWPENADRVNSTEMPKGPYSHPQDALQYVLLRWLGTGGSRAVSARQTETYEGGVLTSHANGLATSVPVPTESAPDLPTPGNTPPPAPIVPGLNGLPTLSKGGAWNPFLQSALD